MGRQGAEVTLADLQAEYRLHHGQAATPARQTATPAHLGDGVPVSMQQLRELVELVGRVNQGLPGHSPVTREHLANVVRAETLRVPLSAVGLAAVRAGVAGGRRGAGRAE